MTTTRTHNAVLLCALSFLLSSCVYWTPMSKHPTTSARVIPNVPAQKWDIESCGAGSLSTVLQHYGDPTSMEEWDRTLPRTHGGVMSIDLVIAARQKGFDARLVTGDQPMIERELMDGRPVILMLQVIQAPGKGYDFFHYIVLDGIDRDAGLVRVQFGDRKLRWVRFDRLENAWKGGAHTAILIRQKDPAADALRAGVTLEEKHQYAEAAAEYRRVLADHPDSTIAWTNLGNVEVQLKNDAAAEDAFRKAIALDSTSADALNNLAWLLYQQKRFDEAEQLARRAVVSPAPDPWQRLDTLARIQVARGACVEAVQTWERAIAGVPPTHASDRNDMAKAMADAKAICPQ